MKEKNFYEHNYAPEAEYVLKCVPCAYFCNKKGEIPLLCPLVGEENKVPCVLIKPNSIMSEDRQYFQVDEDLENILIAYNQYVKKEDDIRLPITCKHIEKQRVKELCDAFRGMGFDKNEDYWSRALVQEYLRKEDK